MGHKIISLSRLLSVKFVNDTIASLLIPSTPITKSIFDLLKTHHPDDFSSDQIKAIDMLCKNLTHQSITSIDPSSSQLLKAEELFLLTTNHHLLNAGHGKTREDIAKLILEKLKKSQATLNNSYLLELYYVLFKDTPKQFTGVEQTTIDNLHMSHFISYHEEGAILGEAIQKRINTLTNKNLKARMNCIFPKSSIPQYQLEFTKTLQDLTRKGDLQGIRLFRDFNIHLNDPSFIGAKDFKNIETLRATLTSPDLVRTAEKYPNSDRMSALTQAIKNKNTEFVRCLLEAGINPNEFTPGDNQSPLATALQEKAYDICELLLQFGANLNYPSYREDRQWELLNDPEFPLYNQRYEAITREFNVEHLLHPLVDNNQLDLLEKTLKAGINDLLAFTTLTYAHQTQNSDVIELFKQYGHTFYLDTDTSTTPPSPPQKQTNPKTCCIIS